MLDESYDLLYVKFEHSRGSFFAPYIRYYNKRGKTYMEQLLEILTEVNADVDFETCDTLIDDGILDSFDIVSIVGELNDTFDIEITPVDIIPDNFNSAEAMWDMIQRLQD